MAQKKVIPSSTDPDDMKMEPYGLGSRAKSFLSYMNNGKVIVIQHPKDTKDREVLNFGDVLMPVPGQ